MAVMNNVWRSLPPKQTFAVLLSGMGMCSIFLPLLLASIELEKKVDPGIIGGMIVVMADEIIDGSVRYGLDQLEESLQKIKVH